MLERVRFTAIPASHPLGNLIGTPLLDTKAKELKEELLKTAIALRSTSVYSLVNTQPVSCLTQQRQEVEHGYGRGAGADGQLALRQGAQQAAATAAMQHCV